MLLLLSVDFFQNLLFQKKSFKKTIQMSDSLDPDQNQHSFGPNLGPKCLHRLSTDAKKLSQARNELKP